MATSENTLHVVIEKLKVKYNYPDIKFDTGLNSLIINPKMELSDIDLAEILNACKTHPELKYLLIWKIKSFGEKASLALCEYIKTTTSLKLLELDATKICGGNALYNAILASNTLTGFSWAHVNSFAKNEKLKQHLERNKKSENSSKQDSEKNSKEKEFIALVEKLGKKNDYDSSIKLKDNQTRLVIKGFFVGGRNDERLAELFSSCKDYSPLNTIKIENTGLEPLAIKALCDFLEKSKTIIKFSLEDVTLDGKNSKEMLFLALLNNTSITKLKYDEYLFGRDQRKLLEKHIAENKSNSSKATTTQNTTQKVITGLRGASSRSSLSKPPVEVKEEPKTSPRTSNGSSKKEDTSQDLKILLNEYPHLKRCKLEDISNKDIRVECSRISAEHLIRLLKILKNREALKKISLPRMTLSSQATRALIDFMKNGDFEELNLQDCIIQDYRQRENITKTVSELNSTSKQVKGTIIFGNEYQRYNRNNRLNLGERPQKEKELPPAPPPPLNDEEAFPALPTMRPTKRW